jgi:hypothetical protein
MMMIMMMMMRVVGVDEEGPLHVCLPGLAQLPITPLDACPV